MQPVKKLLPLFLLSALSGCDLGEGSKLESLEIVTASGATITGAHQMYPCFRDRLNVIGRFTDGSVGNFSTRVTWSSNAPATVRVLNNSELNTRAVFSNDSGMTIGFNDINGLFYTAGTIVPKGAGGAKITASFLGLSASVDVDVNAASPITVSATPVEGAAAPASLPTVVGFSRSLTARAVLGGQTIDAVQRRQDPGTLELMNPILWQFATLGTFSAGVSTDDVALDREDLFLFDGTRSTTNPDGTANPGTQKATLNPASGTYRAVAVAAPTVQALFDTDAAKGVFCPASPIALSTPVDAFVSLQLSHETDFNGAGVSPNGDLVIGTDEILKTVANPMAAKQDVSTQVGYEVIAADRDFCLNTDPMCTAPVSSILAFNFNLMSTAPGTNGSFVTNAVLNPSANPCVAGLTGNARFCQDNIVDVVKIHACFPSCVIDATTNPSPRYSDVLSIRAVPATLPPNSIAIAPAAAADTMDTAFSFPGKQFQAFATFNAAAPNTFMGGATSGSQNVTRYMGWLARPTGSTTEVSNLLSLFGLYTTTLNAGQAYYLRAPSATTTPPLTGANVTVDITAVPATSTRIGAFPNAATSTVAPSRLTINP